MGKEIGAGNRQDLTDLNRDAAHEEASSPYSTFPWPNRESEVEPARILVVDDDPVMRTYLARLLGLHWRVATAVDGQAAFELAMDHPPDLVLSDVLMPRLDGFGLSQALRRHPLTRHTPIILLSAEGAEESVLEGLDTGADDFMVKPFSSRELIGRVKSHLELSRLRKAYAEGLERANQELETFSYSVSHDLQAPLRAINGFASELRRRYSDQLDERGNQCLEWIQSSAVRMAQLIEALLRLAKISHTPVHRAKVDLTRLSHQIFDELIVDAPERSIEIYVDPDLKADADPGLVGVLLRNLLGNASKYSFRQEHARIEVGAEVREGETIFHVRDNGVGFDMEFAKRLFVPFQRLHPEDEFEGQGIGLATVQRIVHRHGGRVWAEAQPDKGATFYFTLSERSGAGAGVSVH